MILSWISARNFLISVKSSITFGVSSGLLRKKSFLAQIPWTWKAFSPVTGFTHTRGYYAYDISKFYSAPMTKRGPYFLNLALVKISNLINGMFFPLILKP